MYGILYSTQLKEHLDNICKMAKELSKEDASKSPEQFKAEIDFLIVVLLEAQGMVD